MGCIVISYKSASTISELQEAGVRLVAALEGFFAATVLAFVG
jgi:hypothetical protein